MKEQLLTGSLLDTARQIPEIRRFVEAIEACGLQAELQVPEYRTLFAPVDEGLGQAPDHVRNAFEKGKPPELAVRILNFHIVEGRQTEADLRTAATVRTLTGVPAKVEFDSKGSRYAGAHIIRHDIACQNGTIHLLDRMAIPEDQYAG